MGAAPSPWVRVAERPAFLGLLVLLVAIRFAASTVTAFAGIEGMDTRGLDAAFEVYADALIIFLALVIGVELKDQAPRLRRQPWFYVFVVLALAVALQWIGLVSPALRFFTGPLAPWADFLLGITAAAALGVLARLLSAEIADGRVSHAIWDGYWAFALGFTWALLLRSLRLLDVTWVFGWALPSGVLWTLDFGPSILLAGIATVAWAGWTLPRARSTRDRGLALALPAGSAVLALAAALGVLGGFILSNALAWGGSYTVFAPTWVSLPIVGFAIGAFLSTAAILGHRVASEPAWLLLGGIAIAALAGIQTSAGLLASFVGLVAAFVYVARGAAGIVAARAEDRPPSRMRI